ncbi:MAG TPA: DPP IV N-terminal domain-containing protein [Isosphaeraceae bacterium]|jgi:dipeptidyl aminopeptidase/acylaminoacyl peptidase|nr:DPP IV N-terminal domain-containing protein [Isosphaeraceae bacterium]
MAVIDRLARSLMTLGPIRAGNMMKRALLACVGLFFGCWVPAQAVADGPAAAAADLQTVAERSGFKATARYDEEMDLLQRLAATSPLFHLDSIGKTTEGRSIPLLIMADPPVKTSAEAARSGKLVVLLLGSIHAGEVCGKEALPILARELAQDAHPDLLKNLVLAMVPIYNADGNEKVSKDNRPGQNGPEEGTGQRANAQGLDLNRDFIKLDAPETRALVRFVDRWNPDLFLDLHATNGSHHRYTITYEGPKNPAGDDRVIRYARDTMLPEVGVAFERSTGQHAYFYGNFDRDHEKWTTYPATPRFGTTYLGLRNRLAILSEAYAYASYETRVKATRDFVHVCLDYASRHRDAIRRLLDQARETTTAAGREPKADDQVAIRSEAKACPDPVTVFGFVEEERDGVRAATAEPKDYRVSLVQNFVPTVTVARPYAYLVPARFKAAVENLQRHGLSLTELREDIELDLEVYRVDNITRAAREFEGHRAVTLEATPRTASQRVPAGTLLVRTAHPLGTLAVYLLEPQSDDGLAAWNFFDNGLSVGTDFPVARLPEHAPLVVASVPPLPEDRPPQKPITYDALYGNGPPPDFSGSPVSARWLDGEHLLQVKEGRPYRVHAATGRAEPYLDTAPMAKALAGLPTMDQATAEALAGGRGGGGFGGRRGTGRRGSGGSTSFDMDPQGQGALFNHENDLYYATFDGKTAVRLTSTPAREEHTSFSPNGKFVAFVRDFDLWVVDVANQTERALTSGGSTKVRNGIADWVYFEEIFNRDSNAYWWSPDSKRIAFLQFDDSQVPSHTVLNDMDELRRDVEQTPYPRVGEPNPSVKVGVVSVAGGSVRWAELSAYLPGSFLISEVGWWPDSRSIYFYPQDRIQSWLDVVTMPAEGGTTKRLFRETTGAWVESLGKPLVLEDGSFILPSERTGWKHLYLFAPDGTKKRQLTSGEWEVRTVHFVDNATGYLYFSGTRESAIANHLYRLKIDDGSIERLTASPGNHQVSLSPDGHYFIDHWTNLSTPTQVALYGSDGRLVRSLDTNPVPALAEYRFAPRKLVQIKMSDGFLLEGELTTPPDLDRDKSYPVWFTTYGGPHTPTVSDAWNGGRAWDQMLAQEGFVVFRVDPRSASGKGAVSTWTAYKRLGVQELKDIKEAIAWLKKEHPYVDGGRIGMSGHSYGGYVTAYAMTHSNLFAAGIAGAPVTDWHDYDSIYTERYMSTPQENPEGYKASSVVAAAGDLHGRLLILHGLIDDNVSVRNTMRLVHALEQADKDFELMIYPASRHGIFGKHYNRLQIEFIRRTLGGPKDRTP